MPKPRVYVHRLSGKFGYDAYVGGDAHALLESFADVVNDAASPAPIAPAEMAKRLRGIDAILSLNGSGAKDICPEALDEARDLKAVVVSHWWHGTHNAMRDMLEAAGVQVIDESDGCNEAVAEWTVGAAIAGLRHFADYDRQMKLGVEWPSWRAAGQLHGSTVGLVSLGRVGRLVARMMRAFDTRILAFDPGVSLEQAGEMGVELTDLETLFRQSDVITLHAPVTPQTAGMIQARHFRAIRDGAVFINCGRAALVDGEAMRAELAKGRFCAYLDVFAPEPPSLHDPLRQFRNVVMTPHVAGTTPAMFRRCGRKAIERLRDFLGAAAGG
ncbi:MAG: D-3-phosphoglycerate dehydrogenase [candidate division BRC1 bacterium ADurb.BinA364]|nr:MAG: D-3-phosphoglycerate dehydrogenase [candidate division BRC1 bacterium ADurb.BinA364]